MAALASALPHRSHLSVQIFVYTEDDVLWCVAATGTARKIRSELLRTPTVILLITENRGFTFSPNKTAAVHYHTRRHLPERALQLKMCLAFRMSE